MDEKEAGFNSGKSGFGTGFHIVFENGWTVSVQWGWGTYSANHSPVGSLSEFRFDSPAPESPTAEIAAWDASGTWYEFEDDSVKGYQTPAEVLAFMNMIAAK